MADTRKDRRAPVSLKVRFKSATVDEFVEQYAMDISRGGIFIKSKSPMPIGTLLKFEFQLKDESRLIHGVGRVVWKRDGSGGEDKPPGMGIKFIKMDPQSRSLVEQIVSQRGDSPGEFEQGRQKVKSAKQTKAFFPAPLPLDQLPSPEDSTQVRHASEFLAEALSAGDEDAAKEAAESAEKARKRTEEIAKQREEAARREKDGAAAESEPEPEPEPEPAPESEASDDAAAADAALDDMLFDEPEAGAPAEPVADEGQSEREAAEKEAEKRARDEAEAERREREAAAAPREERKRSTPPASAAAAEPEEEESGSMMLPIAIGLVAVVGIGYFAYTQMGGQTGPGDVTNIGGEEPATELDAAEELLDAAATADAMASAFPEDAVMVGVRVATSPPGASIEVAGEAQEGGAPLEIQLPIGHEVEVVVRKDGYITGRQMVTAEEGQSALTFELEELPWVIAVNVTPSEARVMAGGNVPDEIGEITLTREPRGPVSVSASLRGYAEATEQVLLTAFSEEGERMLARLTITLEERGRRPTMDRPSMMSMATMTTETTDSGDPETAGMETATMDEPTMDEPTMEAPTMEAPTMEAPTMEAGGGEVPDNPF